MRFTTHRSRALRGIVPVLLAASLAAVPAAQGQVWVVDDDLGPDVDFTTIQQAVDAAADQDMILIRAGNYGRFDVVDRALTIVGEDGVVVSAVATPFGLEESPLTVSSLSAEKAVAVRNLTLVTFQLAGKGIDELIEGAVVTDCQGPVLFEDCNMEPQSGIGFKALDSDAVTLRRCRVDAGVGFYYSFNNEYWDSAGLLATNSDVYVYDTNVVGTLGPDAFDQIFTSSPAGQGGRGAQISGGSLTVQGSTIHGGDGGSSEPPACAAGADGGVGIRHTFGAEVRLLDSTVAGGAAGLSGVGCVEPDGEAGAQFEGDASSVELLDGLARSFEWASPVVGGGLLPTTYSGQPGDFAFLVVSVWLGDDQYFPSFGMTLHLDADPIVLPLGVLPTGELQVSYDAPPLGGIAEFVQLSAQAAYFDSEGTAFLSGPSVASILHQDGF